MVQKSKTNSDSFLASLEDKLKQSGLLRNSQRKKADICSSAVAKVKKEYEEKMAALEDKMTRLQNTCNSN